MADKEKAETTIRIYASTKKQLKELKLANEGDAVVIARILKENKELRHDKEMLYKIILKTSDSVAKIETLKKYLNEMLADDPNSISESIGNIKEMLTGIGEPVPQILLNFESYVNENL